MTPEIQDENNEVQLYKYSGTGNSGIRRENASVSIDAWEERW